MSLKRGGNVAVQKLKAGTRQTTARAWNSRSRPDRTIPKRDSSHAETNMQNPKRRNKHQVTAIG